MKPRVRFAPSPTGFLHIGGVRTALFNWLFARKEGGDFILRIEDTDRERSTEENLKDILEGMLWLRLDWDEGPHKDKNADCPHFQSQRMPIYKKFADRLLEAGKLYRCYCTPEELQAEREAAQREKRPIRYDGRCREKGEIPGKPFSLRLRMPDEGETVVNDRVLGEVRFKNQEIGDWICVRSDGTPTYNFCVVIDDVDMGITHVLRGDDHLNNTPKQIVLFEALEFSLPEFVHLPMILGKDRKGKLSKRHGAASILDLREKGYLADAVINYLARLCWSHGDQEIFTREELVGAFQLKGLGKSAAAFDEEKLEWVNFEHMRKLSDEQLLEEARPFFEKAGIPLQDPDRDLAVLRLMRERARSLVQLAEASKYFYLQPEMDSKAEKKFLTAAIGPALRDLHDRLEGLGSWTEEGMEPLFKAVLEKFDLKMKALAQAVRVSLTGNTVSPSIYEVLVQLGKKVSLGRLGLQADRIDSRANPGTPD